MKIEDKIDRLKEEKNAIILAHNYQIPEIQNIADFMGDSLGLSIKATETDGDIIIFCGVDFMAQSAKILNPEKTVILPDEKATCPMAAMVDAEGLRKMKKNHPNAIVVSYVNTTAEVKAESDICCTSSNAVDVVESLKEKEVIFVPDKNLGLYVQRFVNKKMIFWPGLCPTHYEMKASDFMELKKKHPNAKIMAHPECIPEVIDVADHVYSTGGMVRHVSTSNDKEFIIGTERGLCYRLKRENPEKEFYPINGKSCNSICPPMKRITLEKVLKSLENLEPQIRLSKEIIERARLPLERMIKLKNKNEK